MFENDFPQCDHRRQQCNCYRIFWIKRKNNRREKGKNEYHEDNQDASPRNYETTQKLELLASASLSLVSLIRSASSLLLLPFRSVLLLLLATCSGILYMRNESILISSLWSNLSRFSNTIRIKADCLKYKVN